MLATSMAWTAAPRHYYAQISSTCFVFDQWADTPARLFHRITVGYLDKTGPWSGALKILSTLSALNRFDSDDLILEQQFFYRPTPGVPSASRSAVSTTALTTPFVVPFCNQVFYEISGALRVRSREYNPSGTETMSHRAIPSLPAAVHPRRSSHC
jgi:hypothetical protein